MIRLIASLFLTLAVLTPLSASADPENGLVEARILPGWQMADGSHMAALHLRLENGWKTYWRAPGDAGIPPQFDWSGSGNLGQVDVKWPTPRAISQLGVRTIGYSDLLVLPIKLTPARPGREITLSGKLEIGVCNDICVPVTLRLSQNLPRNHTKPDPRIVAALAERPLSGQEAGVTRVACTISAKDDGLHLRAEVDLPKTGPREIAVVETGDARIWVAQSKTRRQGKRLIAETDLYHVEGRAFALQRSNLRITVLGGGKAVDIQGCPAG